METGAIIGEIITQYYSHGRGWMHVGELQGLTRDELKIAFEELLDEEDFQAEPQPHPQFITERDRELAPVIGREARHMIRWGA